MQEHGWTIQDLRPIQVREPIRQLLGRGDIVQLHESVEIVIEHPLLPSIRPESRLSFARHQTKRRTGFLRTENAEQSLRDALVEQKFRTHSSLRKSPVRYQ